jgi:AcrR family transcriptional regulator
MDEIAKACDLGKATIYAEFTSKEELLGAVVAMHAQEAQRMMKERIAAADGKYLETLREILLFRISGIYERVTRHFHNVDHLISARNGLKDKMQQHREEENRILANLLERAALNKEISSSQNYFRLAKLLKRGLIGLYPPAVLEITPDVFAQEAKDTINLLLAGLTGKHGI